MKAEWEYKVNLPSETVSWSLGNRKEMIIVESCPNGLDIGVYDTYEGREVILDREQVSVLHKLLGIYLETEDLPTETGLDNKEPK